ncbi:hypothetical protein CAAN1_12S04896 [[Candida] anglica]|uniref:ATP synthase subunit e, mitochondrial n=1 Tax=[Candida] anglica TaxID=148631 RepID=A0ABP0E6P1_9ASCO
MSAVAVLTKPINALLLGGAVYGSWAIYMSQNYYKNSSMRKIFVNSDKQYEAVKIGEKHAV